MDFRRRSLTLQEIRDAISVEFWREYGPIISPKQLGEIATFKRATVYEWIRKGRLDGCFRRRGKHLLIWRDRALLLLFTGPDWDD